MSTQELMVPTGSVLTNIEDISPLKAFLSTQEGQAAQALVNRREKISQGVLVALLLAAAGLGVAAWLKNGWRSCVTAFIVYGAVAFLI